MKVLITGITGLIGSHLARRLSSDSKYKIFGLKRFRSNLKNIKDLIGKIELLDGDVEDSVSICKIVSDIGPNYIFHLAAQSYPSESWEAPIFTFNVNVIGTLNVLEAARRMKSSPKIFIACSSAEYGLIRSKDCPVKEDHSLLPVNPYGVSKVAQELLGRQYHFTYGMKIYLGRFFNQIGPGQDERCSIQTFCKQVVDIEKGISLPTLYVGNLSTKRDFLDVRDGVRCVLDLMAKGKVGEVYNICSGKAYLLKDILKLILGKTKKKIKVKKDEKRIRLIDEPIIQGDNTKIRKEFGFEQRISIKESIEDILNYWRGR